MNTLRSAESLPEIHLWNAYANFIRAGKPLEDDNPAVKKLMAACKTTPGDCKIKVVRLVTPEKYRPFFEADLTRDVGVHRIPFTIQSQALEAVKDQEYGVFAEILDRSHVLFHINSDFSVLNQGKRWPLRYYLLRGVTQLKPGDFTPRSI